MKLNIIVGIVSAIAVISTALASPNDNKMNFSDLLKLYMQNEADDSTLMDWSTGSGKKSPIVWLHNGVIGCDDATEQSYGFPFCRSGEVILTFNNKPITQVLEKKITPGKWDMKLMGVRNGFMIVSISSQILDSELPLDKLKTLTIRKYRCGGAKPSEQANQIYIVSSKGKKPLYLDETWSCGNHCTTNYVLYYSKNQADDAKCMSEHPYKKGME